MAATAASAALVVLAAMTPFVGAGLRSLLMDVFAPVCHQLPPRSFHLHGVPLAVCARCIGIYGGLLGGALVMPVLRYWDAQLYARSRMLLIGSVLPLAVDWGGDIAGLWDNTQVSRLVTGLLFGAALGYLLCRAAIQLFSRRA